jgi:hypothetical protein
LFTYFVGPEGVVANWTGDGGVGVAGWGVCVSGGRGGLSVY